MRCYLLILTTFCFSLFGNTIEVVSNGFHFNNYETGGHMWDHAKRRFEAAGYDVVVKAPSEVGEGDFVIFNDAAGCRLSDILRVAPHKRILVVFEPPTYLPIVHKKGFLNHFSKVITWNDSFVDNKRVFKGYYGIKHSCMPSPTPFSQRKLVCMILSCSPIPRYKGELHSSRRKIARFFDANPQYEFNLYGGKWESQNLKHVYHGALPMGGEHPTLNDHRFSIVLENWQNDVGYITEKIFNSFASVNVPVYLGANNASRYIPKGCFIDYRDFDSLHDLYKFLNEMDEKTYHTYQNNIRKYMESEQANRFTSEYMGKLIVDVTLERI